jgi:LPS sulfotransferase NodH
MEVSSKPAERPFYEVRAKVFICSSERTGSTLLCRAMMHYGIGVPREYFNPTRIREFAALYKIAGLADGGRLAADKAARQQYIIELFKHRVANGIFASKIQWGQYASFLENAEGDALLSQGHFIHLFREDLLAQAISRHIAVETGRWGVDGRVTSRPSPKPRFFDVDLIEGYLKLLAQANMNWRLFFARNGISPLMLTYESLTGDLTGALNTIIDVFRLQLPPTRLDYVADRPNAARDGEVPPREEIRAHFLRARRRVVQWFAVGSNVPAG